MNIQWIKNSIGIMITLCALGVSIFFNIKNLQQQKSEEETQFRAYIDIADIGFTTAGKVFFSVKNTGSTPASNVDVRSYLSTSNSILPKVSFAQDDGGHLSPNDVELYLSKITKDQLEELKSNTNLVVEIGFIDFGAKSHNFISKYKYINGVMSIVEQREEF